MSKPGLTHSRWANASSTRQPLPNYHNLKPSTSNPNLPSHLTNTNNAKPITATINTNSSSSSAPTQPNFPSHTLFLTTLRRLKWKSSFLLLSHHRALTNDTTNAIGPHHTFPITSSTGRPNAATLMFKSDFFEFYALLERCLVALLGVFSISVSAEYGSGNSRLHPPSQPSSSSTPLPSSVQLNQSVHANISSNTLIGDTHSFHNGTHRFHANVLSALDTPTSPLHESLGTGPVRLYLGLAKEFRNRWKEVQDEKRTDEDGDDEFVGMHARYRRVLEDLRLDEMLVGILSGLEEARGVVGRYLVERRGVVDVEMNGEGEAEDLDLDVDVDRVGGEDVMDWD